MAGRSNKVGLDYFELDCHMDDKVKLIQAEYGLKGFAVFVKLLQKIYGEDGYYCEWTQDRELLFASETGLINGSLQLLRDIVSACVRRNIFSERLFKEYGILTSSGIQKQYLKATAKREVIDLKKEYLLISIPENRKNVAMSSISSGINSIPGGRNEQSRVEKSREENIPPISPTETFEMFWEHYPRKERRSLAEKAYIDLLLTRKVTEEQLIRSAENYAEYIKLTDSRMYLPNNFLEKCIFEDYLPGKYKPPEKKKSGNSFGKFEQHDYDFEALEKELLEN